MNNQLKNIEHTEESSAIIVSDLTRDSIIAFHETLVFNDSLEGVGFDIFPQNDNYMIVITSSFSHKWRNESIPEIQHYFKDKKLTYSIDNPNFLNDDIVID